MILSVIGTLTINVLKAIAVTTLIYNWDCIIPNHLHGRYYQNSSLEKSLGENLGEARDRIIKLLTFLRAAKHNLHERRVYITDTPSNTHQTLAGVNVTSPDPQPCRSPAAPKCAPKCAPKPIPAEQIKRPAVPQGQRCFRDAKHCSIMEARCKSYETADEAFIQERYEWYMQQRRRADRYELEHQELKKKYQAQVRKHQVQRETFQAEFDAQNAEIQRLTQCVASAKQELRHNFLDPWTRHASRADRVIKAHVVALAQLQGDFSKLMVDYPSVGDDQEAAFCQFEEKLRLRMWEFAPHWQHHNFSLATLTATLDRACGGSPSTPDLQQTRGLYRRQLRRTQKMRREFVRYSRTEAWKQGSSHFSQEDDDEGGDKKDRESREKRKNKGKHVRWDDA